MRIKKKQETEQERKQVPADLEGHAPALRAEIFSMERGKEVYEGLRLIRLCDVNYTLLLMADHTPLIGELKGSIAMLARDDEIVLSDIQGYYTLKGNRFRFLSKSIPHEHGG